MTDKESMLIVPNELVRYIKRIRKIHDETGDEPSTADLCRTAILADMRKLEHPTEAEREFMKCLEETMANGTGYEDRNRAERCELIEKVRKCVSGMLLGKTLRFVGTALPYNEDKADQFIHVEAVEMSSHAGGAVTLYGTIYHRGDELNKCSLFLFAVNDCWRMSVRSSLEEFFSRFRFCDVDDVIVSIGKKKAEVMKRYDNIMDLFRKQVNESVLRDEPCHPEEWLP